MIILIGTGHVFDLSQALLQEFDEIQPDCICVELDRQRYQQLLLKKQSGATDKKHQKKLPLLYRLLARFQENLAEKYGVIPGDEMLTAITYAQSHQLPLQLIDMDAQKVFSTLLSSMSIREKLRFVVSSMMGIFISKERVEAELETIQGDFDRYLIEIGKKFPTIKEVLIDRRNQFMADRLQSLNETYDKVVACVGDGHVNGMTELLEDSSIDVKTIRLSDLQNEIKRDRNVSAASFHIDYDDLS